MPDEQMMLPLPESPRGETTGAPPSGGSGAAQEARDQLARIDAAVLRVDQDRQQQEQEHQQQHQQQLSSEAVLKALKQTGGQ